MYFWPVLAFWVIVTRQKGRTQRRSLGSGEMEPHSRDWGVFDSSPIIIIIKEWRWNELEREDLARRWTSGGGSCATRSPAVTRGDLVTAGMEDVVRFLLSSAGV